MFVHWVWSLVCWWDCWRWVVESPQGRAKTLEIVCRSVAANGMQEHHLGQILFLADRLSGLRQKRSDQVMEQLLERLKKEDPDSLSLKMLQGLLEDGENLKRNP